MSAFDALIGTLLASDLAIDIVYHPASGAPVACRAAFAQPDIEVQLSSVKVRDTKRVLHVRASDVANPQRDDTVEIPSGGTTFRVMDFRAVDPSRLVWMIEAGPQ